MNKPLYEIPVGTIFSWKAANVNHKHFYIRTGAVWNNLIICVCVEDGKITELEKDAIVFEEGEFLNMLKEEEK